MSIPIGVRFSVLKRDRFTCVYCGAHPPEVQIEVDHFFPRSAGGSDDYDNLVTACLDCNRGKAATVLDEDAWPEQGSPLWRFVELGANEVADYYRQQFLERDDRTLAEVVESLWPEADY